MIKRSAITFFGLGLFLMGFLAVGGARHVNELAEVSTGEGTLTSDNGESLRIKAIAVFLRESGEAEICLMTSKENFYVGGRWSQDLTSKQSIRLNITDYADGGCAVGSGTVYIQEGCVPVAGLSMTVSKLDGTTLEAEFVAVSTRPCPNP